MLHFNVYFIKSFFYSFFLSAHQVRILRISNWPQIMTLDLLILLPPPSHVLGLQVSHNIERLHRVHVC